MFKIKLLPATYGDSIFITYGEEANPKRVLIDGGTAGTRRKILAELDGLPDDEKEFELVVVTHIDSDHIAGILSMLEKDSVPFSIKDFWFNAYPHLPDGEVEFFGSKQAERLTKALLRHQIPWNQAFQGKAVVVPDDGLLPEVKLAGGLKLTLISPTWKGLADLKPVWLEELEEHNLLPTQTLETDGDEEEDEGNESFSGESLPDVDALAATLFKGDDSEANGSSIALLAEYDGKKVLLAADAHVPVLLSAFDRMNNADPLEVDLFKLSHHGSKGTVSIPSIQRVKASLYAFSTSGARHKHPNAEAVARVIKAADNPVLVFNYKSKYNKIWDLNLLKTRHGYQTVYPADGEEGIEITL